MIGHILRLARHHVYQLKNKSKRSSRWPEVEYKYKEKLTFIKRADSQVGSQSPVGVENLRSKEGSIPVEVREMLKCHEE